MVSKEQELYKPFYPPGKTPNEWCISQQDVYLAHQLRFF